MLQRFVVPFLLSTVLTLPVHVHAADADEIEIALRAWVEKHIDNILLHAGFNPERRTVEYRIETVSIDAQSIVLRTPVTVQSDVSAAFEIDAMQFECQVRDSETCEMTIAYPASIRISYVDDRKMDVKMTLSASKTGMLDVFNQLWESNEFRATDVTVRIEEDRHPHMVVHFQSLTLSSVQVPAQDKKRTISGRLDATGIEVGWGFVIDMNIDEVNHVYQTHALDPNVHEILTNYNNALGFELVESDELTGEARAILRNFVHQVRAHQPLVGDYSSNTSIRNLDVHAEGETLFLHEIQLALEGKGLSGNDGNMSVKLGMSAPSQDMFPTEVVLDFALHNVPFAGIFSEALAILATLATEDEPSPSAVDRQLARSGANVKGSILGSGSEILINEVRYESSPVNGEAHGAFRADSRSITGYVGSFRIEIEKLDAVIGRLQAHVMDGEPSHEVFGLLALLVVLKEHAITDVTVDGQRHAFNVDLREDGTTLINNNDLSGLLKLIRVR